LYGEAFVTRLTTFLAAFLKLSQFTLEGEFLAMVTAIQPSFHYSKNEELQISFQTQFSLFPLPFL
jgi:hypothetical protein